MSLRCLYMNVDASCASKRMHEHVFLCVCACIIMCVLGEGARGWRRGLGAYLNS